MQQKRITTEDDGDAKISFRRLLLEVHLRHVEPPVQMGKLSAPVDPKNFVHLPSKLLCKAVAS